LIDKPHKTTKSRLKAAFLLDQPDKADGLLLLFVTERGRSMQKKVESCVKMVYNPNW